MPDIFSPFSNPGPVRLFGREAAIVRTLPEAVPSFDDTPAPSAVCFGVNLKEFSGDSYTAFGDFLKSDPVTTPIPFPLTDDFGATPFTEAAILAYGYGGGDAPFYWAIDADGKYFFWGMNTHFVAGDDSITDFVQYPVHTCDIPFPSSELTYAVGGGCCVALLRSNGEVWGIGGSNYSGTSFHGLAGGDDLHAFTLYYRDCIDVDVLDSCGLIIERGGRLRCVGADWFGRFGIRETNDHSGQDGPGTGITWHNTPASRWNVGGGFVKARFGMYETPARLGFMLALRKDGSLWFAGANNHLLSGRSDADLNYQTDALEQVAGLPPLVDFACNDAAAFGLDALGNVWSWGLFATDPNGTGNATGRGLNQGFPIPGKLLTGAAGIAAARDTGFASVDGKTFAWGAANNNGTGRNHVLSSPTLQGILPPPLRITPQIIGGGSALILTANPA